MQLEQYTFEPFPFVMTKAVLFALLIKFVWAQDSGSVPDQYIVRFPKASTASWTRTDAIKRYSNRLRGMGLKTVDVVQSSKADMVLMNVTNSETLDQLQAQGAKIYENMRYRLNNAQPDAPPHLVVFYFV